MNSAPAFSKPQYTAYFPALTGVRALAAYLVYAHHVRLPEGSLPKMLEKLIAGGGAGVTIFFVLSGFLIAHRYEALLKEKTIAFGSYMLRRFARIYPLYLVLSVFMLLWQQNDSGWQWFLNLSLLKAFFEEEKYTGILQGWSLTVEESFYFLAPLLFWSFRKIGVSTVVLLIASGCLLVLIAKQAGSDSFLSNYDLMLGWSIFGRGFEFFCGYKLAHFIKSGEQRERKGSVFTWLVSLGIIAGLVVIGYAIDLQFTFEFPFSPFLLINNFIFPLAITLWFFGLISEQTVFSKILSSRIFQVLGKSSYAFYLIHFGWFFEAFYFHVHASRISAFFFLVACSVGIYYLFEEPVNQYIRRKFDVRELKKKMQQPDFLKQKA
ncbi:acyltransferase [Adhaeribacter sp. BT258]|uniref:Acyltransferase n=1 Tax=Adhaeribacter terrigena TaxID=2793070 RepID=A0ABS1BYU1_9BACT|nr:acyltransferase [Adhaeribacter terrigena]MBK0402343.1 acyltransferase [Adhaeribacter terrigena]